jgi:DNA invertase Pin-like site-specific DNA recombinase
MTSSANRPYRIAYMRTSTDAQETAIQRADIERHGFDKIFMDEGISGKVKDRPELMKALDALQPGNEFIVWKLDRMGRGAAHLMAIIEDLQARGINFVSLKEQFDLSTPIGRAMYGIAAVFAQMERETIEERRNAGIKLARDKGTKFGRKPLSDPDAKGGKAGDLAQAITAVQRGMSQRQAAQRFNISRTTLARHIEPLSQPVNSDLVSVPKSRRKSRVNGHSNGLAHN